MGTEVTKDEIGCNAAAVLIPKRDVLERSGDDLNKSVVRGIFGAAQILQGALQLDSDPDAVQRIEVAIEVDHIATCGWPYANACPRCFPPFSLSEGL